MLSLFYVFCLDISNGENGVLKLFFIENNFFREDFDQVLDIMLYDGTSSEETSSESKDVLELLLLDAMLTPKRSPGPRINLQDVDEFQCEQWFRYAG